VSFGGRKRRRKISVPDETLDVAAALSTSRQASTNFVHHRRRWVVGISRRWHRPTKSRVDCYNVRGRACRGRQRHFIAWNRCDRNDSLSYWSAREPTFMQGSILSSSNAAMSRGRLRPASQISPPPRPFICELCTDHETGSLA
jgi:hypothetical protein